MVNTEPARKRTKLDFSEETVVLVGKPVTRITVHKNVLTSSSEFFKAACGGSWKESNEKSISLPETTEDIFRIYVGWLYTGNAEVLYEDEHGESAKASYPTNAKVFGAGFNNILKSYILGDFLDDEDFCNTLIDELMLLSQRTMSISNARSLEKYWAQLPQGSGLRRLLVDLEVFYGKIEDFSSDDERWPYSYLIEVMKAYAADRDTDGTAKEPEKRGRCYYHQYSEGSRKCE